MRLTDESKVGAAKKRPRDIRHIVHMINSYRIYIISLKCLHVATVSLSWCR